MAGQQRKERQRPADDATDGTGGGVTLVNPGTTAVIYDDDGHSLEAGGRVTVPALDGTGRHVVAKGYLVVESDNTSDPARGQSAHTGESTPDTSDNTPGAPTRD